MAAPTEEEQALLEQWAKDKKLGSLADDEAAAAKRAKEEEEESSVLHCTQWDSTSRHTDLEAWVPCSEGGVRLPRAILDGARSSRARHGRDGHVAYVACWV